MSADPHGLGDNLLRETTFSSNATGVPLDVLVYGQHSYQCTATGPVKGFVNIQASNSKDGPFSTLTSVQVNSGEAINVTPGHEAGFLYNSKWNFVRSRITITGYEGGEFKIYENHIY